MIVDETLLIAHRFCGPPSSGNGGYVAGALAERLSSAPGEAVTVSLRHPPPLDVPMEVIVVDGVATLSRGGSVIATAAIAQATIDPVEPVSYDEAVSASRSYPGLANHPFPTCFSCGTDRTDGLRIFPGPVDPGPGGTARAATPWTPDATIAGADGQQASLAATWAALDCSGGWAGGELTGRMMVLARMTAIIDELPRIGEPHVAMGQKLGEDGRKTITASTLHDSDGRVVGRAEHLWVAVDPALFGRA
ncbi:MAG: hypothetical protein JWR35_3546 [Marmoricola sp.]|jgi:hypothetical protein|nr:hypothetical protein [Marmoricola sp.]